ncbi:uncharacterized protein LOC134428002 [Melospiza melodia melodia]|uniref:uncharacterized protein LOC134428002 n=1 Tax=Melospiza melodia melodia TaxID=1914991 RepID=UPI002FD44841
MEEEEEDKIIKKSLSNPPGRQTEQESTALSRDLHLTPSPSLSAHCALAAMSALDRTPSSGIPKFHLRVIAVFTQTQKALPTLGDWCKVVWWPGMAEMAGELQVPTCRTVWRWQRGRGSGAGDMLAVHAGLYTGPKQRPLHTWRKNSVQAPRTVPRKDTDTCHLSQQPGNHCSHGHGRGGTEAVQCDWAVLLALCENAHANLQSSQLH